MNRAVDPQASVERVDSPRDLTARAWWHALRDAAKRFADRELTDRAAALTYYAVLSIFPLMIVLVSLLGVLGTTGTVDSFLRIVDELGPASAVDAFQEPVEAIVDNRETAAVALIFGGAAALWTASTYMGGFIRATNVVYGVEEARPFYLRRPLQLAITLAMVVVIALVLIALVLTGPLAEAIGDEIGVGDTALTAWSIAKWPLLFLLVVVSIALLYRVGPHARHVGMRWILPGSLLATLLWIAASAAFAAYVSNFGSYANTYGGLAGVIVFLIWVWVTNVAILFGAQFAAELERTGAAASGAPPPATEPVALRDPPAS